MDLSLLHGLAETQLGLVTRGQLLALGFSDDTIAGLVRRGYLRVAHPGVYVVPGTPADPRRRLLAAAMAAGPQAVVSHQSARWLNRLEPGLPLRIEVTGPQARRPPVLAGLAHAAGRCHHPQRPTRVPRRRRPALRRQGRPRSGRAS